MNREEKDIELLGCLFKEHYHFLCLVSLSILKDKASSKDVVQDFFLSYCKNYQHISLSVSFKAYASKAVRNLSLQLLNKIEREKAVIREVNILEEENSFLNHHTQDDKKLLELVDKLPEKRKDIFVSYVISGQSYSEIAENNGISINTVKTQMKRAYQFLRSEANKDLLYFFLLISQLY